MNTEKQLCSPVYEVAAHIKELRLSGVTFTTAVIKELMMAQQALSAECDQILSAYNDSGVWTENHYLEGNQAIMNETRLSRRSVDQAIGRGKLLHDFPCLADAVDDGVMTTDHISALLPLTTKKYNERLAYDIDLIVENAGALAMPEFSKAITRWKNIIDREREETSSEYQAFQDRHFEMWEMAHGWKVEGELDTITGKMFKKALDDISSKNWKATAIEDGERYLKSEQYADAIGFLAQGYITHKSSAIDPNVDDEGGEPKEFHYSTTALHLHLQPILLLTLMISIPIPPQDIFSRAISKLLLPLSLLIHKHSLNKFCAIQLFKYQ